MLEFIWQGMGEERIPLLEIVEDGFGRVIADDDENLSSLIRLVLRDDYDITVVLDGIEAWDILQRL